MFVHFYQMYLDYCFQGLKNKKNPEPQLFSRVGDWLQGWTHSRGYLKKKKKN